MILVENYQVFSNSMYCPLWSDLNINSRSLMRNYSKVQSLLLRLLSTVLIAYDGFSHFDT